MCPQVYTGVCSHVIIRDLRNHRIRLLVIVGVLEQDVAEFLGFADVDSGLEGVLVEIGAEVASPLKHQIQWEVLMVRFQAFVIDPIRDPAHLEV